VIDDVGDETLLVFQFHRIECATVGVDADEEFVAGGDFVHDSMVDRDGR
jgi:hypothetical protein